MLIRIKYFWIRNESRKALTPMRRIGISERTEITKMSSGSMPSVTNMEGPPLDSLYIRDLSLLNDTPPFVVSVAGVLSNIQDVTMSHAGAPMRSFQLQDNKGRYVLCCALGRHAQNPSLSEKMKWCCTLLTPSHQQQQQCLPKFGCLMKDT